MLKRLFDRRHGRFLAMLSEHIDAELSEQDRVALEAHLQGCDSCSGELQSLRTTVQLLSRMPEVEAPRSFRLSPAGEPADKPALAVGAALGTHEPPRERPVFLWAMRVSTALAVVAFTVMLAGSVTGLFDGGAGDGGQFDAPAASDEAQMESMAVESDDAMNESEPEAMMASESDLPPLSTPMMRGEPTAMPGPVPTATPAPQAMMEPTAIFEEEAAPEATATPAPQFLLDEDAGEISESATRAEAADNATTSTHTGKDSNDAGAPELSPVPKATAVPVPTSTPAPTATPTPAPTTLPQPTATPRSAPTTAPEPTATFIWAPSDQDPLEEAEEGAGGVVLWLTTGLGALAAALVMGTIYLTVRRRRGAG